ncbi:carboxymuconolactone decarboxylase family protein [Rhodopila sp.]|uniref:carboxymuconolactone decarboxylase family protein n=1 Tax=Rhodopila sp. TaxID=2480087 RepID=UPI003D0B73CF
MPDPDAWLGGRLPLLDAISLSPAQKTLWDRMDATMGRWAGKTGFDSKTFDNCFIGPFNPMLRSPDIALTFVQLQMDESKHTSLSDRVRQVVILSVGSVWKAHYELSAHAAAACHAGFSDTCVEALVAGHITPEFAADEAIAQRLALVLTAGHAVDDELFTEALRHFGETGLVDFAVLAGCYHLVCGLLNLFAVPAPRPA